MFAVRLEVIERNLNKEGEYNIEIREKNIFVGRWLF